MKITQTFALFCTCVLLLAACQPAKATAQVSLFSGEELTPFATNTLTPTATATPQYEPTATLAPTNTSTPTTYTVKSGETLFSIAANHGLTTDQIKAANPSINPYLLGPGMTIVLPASTGGGTATQSAPASTPYPLIVGEPKCSPSLTGGLYCFVEITNGQELMTENITAEFRLTTADNSEVLSQKALVPLNRIASGEKLPLFAYFPPPVMNAPVISLQLQTATSVNPTSLQAAKVKIDAPEINISANGLSAMVNAQAFLEAAEGVSGKIWIAAVAYDDQNTIVGIRRFSSTSSLNPGESVTVSLNIYSIGGKIARVELYGEANP